MHGRHVSVMLTHSEIYGFHDRVLDMMPSQHNFVHFDSNDQYQHV